MLTDTVNYIVDQIYIHKRLTFWSKLVPKTLLTKITTENVFAINGTLHEQIDGGMGVYFWRMTADGDVELFCCFVNIR